MLKVNYQFIEKNDSNNDIVQTQENKMLDLLNSGQKIINEARKYRESVVCAAESQAERIIKQAHDLAKQQEEKVLKDLDKEKKIKENQIHELKCQLLEIQEQINVLFSNRYDIFKSINNGELEGFKYDLEDTEKSEH